jgi:hypothetical protein
MLPLLGGIEARGPDVIGAKKALLLEEPKEKPDGNEVPSYARRGKPFALPVFQEFRDERRRHVAEVAKAMFGKITSKGLKIPAVGVSGIGRKT